MPQDSLRREMIAKKPTVLLAACNTLQWHPAACQSTTSSWQRRSTRPAPKNQTGYATVAGDERDSQEQSERQENSRHVWPQATKGRSSPTPYQIFDLKQNASYSKAKYYQLVKLYHPDLSNSGSSNGISDHVKMERYRLVVAAHTILSDPAKRSAYDRFGAGWDGRAESGQSHYSHSAGPFSHSYGNPNDPIWNNATWEDWERFHQRRDGVYPEKRAPVYMANSYFLALIVALAVMGSSLNVNRAKDAGHYIVEQRDLVHDRAAKELRRVRQEASTLSSRQDKIDFFVRQREATLATTSGDFDALREERANRVLADREVCGSEGVSQQDEE